MRQSFGAHVVLLACLSADAFLLSVPRSRSFSLSASLLSLSSDNIQESVRSDRPNQPIRRRVRAPSAPPGQQSPASAACQESTILTSTRFDEIKSLHPSLLRAIHEMGLEQMTEIQAQSWPHAFNGTSCVGKAKTGTGKTLSFLLPSIQRLIDTRTFLPGRSVGILIIAPTRELAQQIGDEAERLLKYMPKTWTVQSMYGGTQMRRDSNMWAKQKPAILVSTTARLLDHIRETRVKGRKFGESILSDIPIIVLDETDRLVEGFWRDIKTISSQLPRPEKRQTLLFSATLPKSVEKSFEQYLPNDYVRIDCVGNIASGERANSQVKQFYLQLTDMDDYVCTLVSLLRSAMTEQPERFKLIVFFPTAKLARFFAEYLSAVVEIGPVWEIHSRMSQSSRSRVSSSFRSATNGILLTSDVTARGMDYPDVTCVIQVGTFLSLQNLHQLYLLLCLIFDELPVRRSL